MFHVCLFVSCAKKQNESNSPAFQTLVESFECLSMTCTNQPRLHMLTTGGGGWPRPFHHVRAGQPLPKIVYEDDESLE